MARRRSACRGVLRCSRWPRLAARGCHEAGFERRGGLQASLARRRGVIVKFRAFCQSLMDDPPTAQRHEADGDGLIMRGEHLGKCQPGADTSVIVALEGLRVAREMQRMPREIPLVVL